MMQIKKETQAQQQPAQQNGAAHRQRRAVEAFNAFARRVQPIAAVERILSASVEETFTIYTVGNHLSTEDCYRIYAVEREIYRGFPDLEMDFIVTDRRDDVVTLPQPDPGFPLIEKALTQPSSR